MLCAVSSSTRISSDKLNYSFCFAVVLVPPNENALFLFLLVCRRAVYISTSFLRINV